MLAGGALATRRHRPGMLGWWRFCLFLEVDYGCLDRSLPTSEKPMKIPRMTGSPWAFRDQPSLGGRRAIGERKVINARLRT